MFVIIPGNRRMKTRVSADHYRRSPWTWQSGIWYASFRNFVPSFDLIVRMNSFKMLYMFGQDIRRSVPDKTRAASGKTTTV